LNKDNPVKRKRGRPRKQELITIELRAYAPSELNPNAILIAPPKDYEVSIFTKEEIRQREETMKWYQKRWAKEV